MGDILSDANAGERFRQSLHAAMPAHTGNDGRSLGQVLVTMKEPLGVVNPRPASGNGLDHEPQRIAISAGQAVLAGGIGHVQHGSLAFKLGIFETGRSQHLNPSQFKVLEIGRMVDVPLRVGLMVSHLNG